MTFDIYSYRFTFAAREAIFFPAGAPSNILRGALGRALRRIACPPECPGHQGLAARQCHLRAHCAYARTFEPASMSAGPSGLSDWPRPFVIRAANLNARTVAPGERFSFDVNLFDAKLPARDWLGCAFREVTQEGLGPSRGRAELVEVGQIDGEGGATLHPISIRLDGPCRPTDGARIVFRTPTELKSAGQSVAHPDFPILFARVRDRVSTLRALYGAGPLDIDFRSMGERARAVRLTGCNLQYIHAQRRSSRSGLSHAIGGFIGSAEYQGPLTEFLPLLETAQWTGVGRHCVWGNGELRIEPIERI